MAAITRSQPIDNLAFLSQMSDTEMSNATGALQPQFNQDEITNIKNLESKLDEIFRTVHEKKVQTTDIYYEATSYAKNYELIDENYEALFKRFEKDHNIEDSLEKGLCITMQERISVIARVIERIQRYAWQPHHTPFVLLTMERVIQKCDEVKAYILRIFQTYNSTKPSECVRMRVSFQHLKECRDQAESIRKINLAKESFLNLIFYNSFKNLGVNLVYSEKQLKALAWCNKSLDLLRMRLDKKDLTGWQVTFNTCKNEYSKTDLSSLVFVEDPLLLLRSDYILTKLSWIEMCFRFLSEPCLTDVEKDLIRGEIQARFEEFSIFHKLQMYMNRENPYDIKAMQLLEYRVTYLRNMYELVT